MERLRLISQCAEVVAALVLPSQRAVQGDGSSVVCLHLEYPGTGSEFPPHQGHGGHHLSSQAHPSHPAQNEEIGDVVELACCADSSSADGFVFIPEGEVLRRVGECDLQGVGIVVESL